jgi:protein-L-isoaspartate(D-aspartate) O-methyltransferase
MASGTNDPATADHLRDRLADELRDRGAVRSDRVDAAVRSVPRHVFVRQFKPAATLEEAYADDPVHTKLDAAGVSISAVSQPTVNALLLELTDARPGMCIKEAGAGSGLFAAYLAHIVGADGHVYTFDVDDDLVDGARAALTAAGVTNVTAILGDGSAAHPDGAPYDRVVATVGAHGIPRPWLDQLAPGGRLVVPLRIRGSVSRAIAFEQDAGGRWRSVRSDMCTFMPLRGVAQDPRRLVTLGPDAAVTLQVDQDQTVDAPALAGIFDEPRTEMWTGMTFRGSESQEWLDLYLACALDNSLSRMTTTDTALNAGLVLPRFGGATMATVDTANLAYLTLQASAPADDGAHLYEVGVAAHGPGGDELARHVAAAVHTWNHNYRGRPVAFEIVPTNAPSVAPRPGLFTVDTPLNRLVVQWPPRRSPDALGSARR